MPTTAAHALSSLQRRPLAERRILALIAYFTAAVVILAFWLTSLGRTFTLTPARPATLEPVPSTPTPGARSAAPSSAPAEPVAPLAALRDLVATAAADSKSFLTELKNIRNQTPVPPLAEQAPVTGLPLDAPSALPATLITPTESPTPAKPTVLTPPAPAHAAAPALPAQILAAALPPFLWTASAAQLLTIPLDVAVESPPSRTLRSRIGEVITYNLAEIGRTAVDVYQYFKE